MNNASAFLSNVSFLPVCYYISAFSTFFTSINLMTVSEKNQSVPVINALFEYLETAKNKSLAKSHLLGVVLTKAKIHHENTTLDMKYVNETYQYIINESLFCNCGNIEEYLSKNRENVIFSIFKDVVHKNLSDCVNDDLCATKNGSTKLTPLAIEKLLEYIMFACIQKKASRTSNTRKIAQLERFRRQTNNSEFNMTDEEILKEFALLAENLLLASEDSEKFADADYTSDDFLSDKQAIASMAQSVERDLGSLEDKSNENKFNYLFGLNDSIPANRKSNDFYDFAFLVAQRANEDHDSSEDDTSKNDTDYFISDRPVSNSLLLKSYDDIGVQSNNNSNLTVGIKFFEIEDHEKSKRMLSIEKAAHSISLRLPNSNFTDSLLMLANFLLKLMESTTLVPTYDELALDYCNNNSTVPPKYNNWKIPNHTFIYDVLFKAYFNDDTIFNNDTFFHKVILNYKDTSFHYTRKSSKIDLELYENSIELKNSLRVADFLVLKLNLPYATTERGLNSLIIRERLTAALYRLALRECEEDWLENENILYKISHDKFSVDYMEIISSGKRNYTFEKFEEFSTNYIEEKKNLEKLKEKKNHILFTIRLENQAGIVNISRLFESTTGRYVIPPDTTFSINRTEFIIIDKRIVFLIEMVDNRSKEEKMIDMVNKLHHLLTNSSESLFSYYN